MTDLNIKQTEQTPEIRFQSSGSMIIKGKSLPEDPIKFFKPLFQWVENVESEKIKFDIKLEYVNTSSSKNILELIKIIDKNQKIRQLDLNWYYEVDDMDMLEFGEMVARSIKRAKTNYIECEEIDD